MENKNISTIDKREAQLKRETNKSIAVLLTGFLLAIFCFMVFKFMFTTTKIKENERVRIEHVKQIKLVKNLTGLKIVHNVQKDYRKYFVSYKHYFSSNEYTIKIEEINFTQFMTIKIGDTINPQQIK